MNYGPQLHPTYYTPQPPPRPDSVYYPYPDAQQSPAPVALVRPVPDYEIPHSTGYQSNRPSSSWSHLQQFQTSSTQLENETRVREPDQHRPNFSSPGIYQPSPVVYSDRYNGLSEQVAPPPIPPAPSSFDLRPLPPPSPTPPSIMDPRSSYGYKSNAPVGSSLTVNALAPSPMPLDLPSPCQPTLHPYPTVEKLAQKALELERLSDSDQICWAEDVLRLVERHWERSIEANYFERPTSPSPSSSHLEPNLQSLLDTASAIIIFISASDNQSDVSLALYLKGKLLSSGVASDLPKDFRQAFKDFEMAAKGGEARAWYRLGKDYEGVNDYNRAKDCYERGARRSDCECTFKIGTAHLLGQLNLSQDPATGLSFLRQASEISTIDFPQASYVYGMLLAGELSVQANIPPNLIIPPSSPITDALFSQLSVARKAIERAAYLNYPPAQFQIGYMYEHAKIGFPYDPGASVMWYTFASQNGQADADMALSKWFLCGADGYFAKNEYMAKDHAEKAAKKGHPNGCFALGYYYETGVGGNQDLRQAIRWYKKAANFGNTDAPARLTALSAPIPTAINMTEHESRLRDTIVRKHTTAKNRSDRESGLRPQGRQQYSNSYPSFQGDFGQATPPVAQFMPQARLQTSMVHDTLPSGPVVPPQSWPAQDRISPNPRPGEIMSPGMCQHSQQQSYSPMPIPMATPSPRPPIPQQETTSSVNVDHNPYGQPMNLAPTVGRHPSEASTGVSTSSRPLSANTGNGTGNDLPLPENKQNGNKQNAGKTEPQTFAEMGFTSKPVEEDGCVIM
ncbi:hypothetical protein L204_104692 [Cryptococcus depauperatus]|nr:hypothetical protein L204_03562 [Cryptococcus depauperatus CBS 7855]